MNLNESLVFTFNQLANLFWVKLEKVMSEIGLHAGQVFVLTALWEMNGQSQAELVRILKVSPPTIYNMVVRMEKSGFLTIQKCEKDSRIMRVYLTEKGTQIKDQVDHQFEKLEAEIFSELNETEKIMFSLLLQKLQKK